MATLYYNNAENDGDLDNLLNWWRDDAYTLQALALPDVGDDAELTGDLNTGTLTCDQATFTPGAGLFNAGTYHCTINFSTPDTILGGEFYGTVNADGCIISGGSYYGPLVNPAYITGDFGVNIFGLAYLPDMCDITSAVCWEDSDVSCIGVLVLNGSFSVFGKISFADFATFGSSTNLFYLDLQNAAISFDFGVTYYYHEGNAGIADPADVREGVSNAGATGTLVVSSGGSGGGVIKMGR